MAQFVHAFVHVASGRKVELVVDADNVLVRCPPDLPHDRMRQIAFARHDQAGEWRFLHRVPLDETPSEHFAWLKQLLQRTRYRAD